MLLRKGVTQKRSKFTRDQPCKSVNSITLHSKNSSINLHFWECRLVWMVLIPRFIHNLGINIGNVGYNLLRLLLLLLIIRAID